MKLSNNEITFELPVSRQDAVRLNQLKGADVYDLIAMAGKLPAISFRKTKRSCVLLSMPVRATAARIVPFVPNHLIIIQAFQITPCLARKSFYAAH